MFETWIYTLKNTMKKMMKFLEISFKKRSFNFLLIIVFNPSISFKTSSKPYFQFYFSHVL